MTILCDKGLNAEIITHCPRCLCLRIIQKFRGHISQYARSYVVVLIRFNYCCRFNASKTLLLKLFLNSFSFVLIRRLWFTCLCSVSGDISCVYTYMFWFVWFYWTALSYQSSRRPTSCFMSDKIYFCSFFSTYLTPLTDRTAAIFFTRQLSYSGYCACSSFMQIILYYAAKYLVLCYYAAVLPVHRSVCPVGARN